MPKFKPRVNRNDEPTDVLVYPWADWCVAQIRAALAAGAELPTFRRRDKLAWIYLSAVIDRAEDLRDRVDVDFDRFLVRRRRRR
jgi:hypothetical protein